VFIVYAKQSTPFFVKPSHPPISASFSETTTNQMHSTTQSPRHLRGFQQQRRRRVPILVRAPLQVVQRRCFHARAGEVVGARGEDLGRQHEAAVGAVALACHHQEPPPLEQQYQRADNLAAAPPGTALAESDARALEQLILFMYLPLPSRDLMPCCFLFAPLLHST
jgi:hypothetical protein